MPRKRTDLCHAIAVVCPYHCHDSYPFPSVPVGLYVVPYDLEQPLGQLFFRKIRGHVGVV
eukprot:5778202-Pyramimonas_sp.AAC.1